jgi:hypothetical protein
MQRSMRRNKLRKAFKTGVILLSCLIILYILFQTVLFTWNPLRLGYNCFGYERYKVYSRSDKIDTIFSNLNSVFVDIENSHNLKFRRRIEIIICEQSDLKKYFPLNPHGPLGIWPKTVILPNSSIEIYRNPVLSVKHELSHLLFLQNYGVLQGNKIWKKNEWLPEGFAMYICNGFPYYMSKQDILTGMNKYGIDYKVNPENILSGRKIKEIPISVRYSIYYHFISYLIEKYGEISFNSFMHDSFKDPGKIRDKFNEHFSVSFNKALVEYGNYLGNYY